MAAGGEDVDAEVRRRRVLDAEAVDAVHAEQDPLALGPAFVRIGDGNRQLAERELDAGRRVHPRDCEAARLRLQRPSDGAYDRVDRGRLRLVVEPDAADGDAVELLPEAERLVGRIEVVFGRHDLVARVQAQPRIHEPEPHRRRVRERNLVRGRTKIRSGGGARLLLERGLRLAQVHRRVAVELAAVAVDRLPDDARVGGEQERRQVDEARIEGERRSAALGGGRGRLRVVVLQQLARGDAGNRGRSSEQHAAPHEQAAPVELPLGTIGHAASAGDGTSQPLRRGARLAVRPPSAIANPASAGASRAMATTCSAVQICDTTTSGAKT